MPYIFGADDPDDRRTDRGDADPGGPAQHHWRWHWRTKGWDRADPHGSAQLAQPCADFADLDVELAGFKHATGEGVVDMDALREAIAACEPGDAILLHGCCHNPTGIDYSNENRDEIAALIAPRACCRSSTTIRGWACGHGRRRLWPAPRSRRGPRGAGGLFVRQELRHVP
ncbi:MAG: aminotransferase class I/II-fold pyridoxal phosphate-dependent enzyme [Novosphingobium sp.]